MNKWVLGGVLGVIAVLIMIAAVVANQLGNDMADTQRRIALVEHRINELEAEAEHMTWLHGTNDFLKRMESRGE